MMIHVVTPGETPAAIARRYGVPLSRLIADNGLDPNQPLVVGQTL
ncbi:MAG: LysM peptidoglycan-binding domain-containing protein, partial [Clostridia bacterium]|nr:LysM peptidoglycan-binding domain-containing protein [Clostridia bacterium]